MGQRIWVVVGRRVTMDMMGNGGMEEGIKKSARRKRGDVGKVWMQGT